MKDGILAKSFVYTAASFGHDGINGFQFVGLPVGGAVPELIDAVAEHVRYTAPLGVPPQPTAEEIALHFPRSTRIIPGAPGGQTLLMQTRYVGQVYQSDGKRGKWGNFLAHVRVIPVHSASTATLIGIARTADWRDGLSDAELMVAKALDLPEELLTPPTIANTDHLDERSRVAGLAAILARLDGDLPLLFPDTDPEHALAAFEDLAAHLPEFLACRLSWSSFEFDAGPGYDVLATIGDTRLTSDSSAYLRLDAPPDDPNYLWAGQTICREGASFWTRLSLFSDLTKQTRLADVLALLRQIDDAGPDSLDPVCAALALLRKGRAEPTRIAAAEEIFARSFGSLGGTEKDNFALLVSAGKEALALSQWSNSDRLWQMLLEWVWAFPSVSAALKPGGGPELLSLAMANAVSAGTEIDQILDIVLAATQHRLLHDSDTATLAAAIAAVLPDKGLGARGAQSILRLAQFHLNAPAHENLILDLLKSTGQAAGLDWLNLVASELPKIAPDIAGRVLPGLEIGILEALVVTPDSIADASRRLLQMSSQSWDNAFVERIERLLKRLDAALPMTGRKQSKIAADLVKAAQVHELDPGAVPNALALHATVSKALLAAVLDDQNLLTCIQSASARDVFAAFFDEAFAALKPESLHVSAKSIKRLWRSDIRDHFVSHTARHFLSGLSRAELVDRVDDAIMAHSRTTVDNDFEDDWTSVCEAVALQLSSRLDQHSFEELVRCYPRSTLVETMARRRNRSVAAVARSVGGTILGLFSRRRGD